MSAVATSWTPDELRRLGDAVELELAARGADGQLSGYTTMWLVAVDCNVYVRSAGGPNRPWYRRAVAAGAGRIRAGAIEADVTFTDAAPHVHAAIDTAYHRKYDRYGPGAVGHVTGAATHPVTIHLVRSTS